MKKHILFHLALACGIIFFLQAQANEELSQSANDPNTVKLIPKSKRTEQDLTLASGFATPAIHGIIPSVSKNGDQVYLFFVNQDETSGGTQPVAQLYDNVNGELVNPKTLAMPAVSDPYAWSGWASDDFTKFSVLESDCNGPGVCGDMRIRILDPNFNVVATRIFNDPNWEFVMGGNFSEDGHYVLFSYAVNAPSPSVSYNTFVFILDATQPDLPTVAGPITISGFDPYYAGPWLFTLTGRNCEQNLYFSFVSHQFDSSASTFLTLPPYFSQVYGVNVNTSEITLIDQVQLPQFSENTVFVRRNRKEALICHGGQCTVNPNAPTIYTVIDPSMIGQLPPDYNAVHILRFDGYKLKLVMKQQTECCSFLLVYPPSNGYTYFLGQSTEIFQTPGDPTTLGPNFQEYYSLMDLYKGPAGLVLRPQNGPFQDVSIPSATAFSQNGKWMVRTGGYGYFNGNPNVDQFGIKNVLLFNVNAAKYKLIK